jgi:hypothetical protein
VRQPAPSEGEAAYAAIVRLGELREEWTRLLALAGAEKWSLLAEDGTTVAELFAGLMADLEVASSRTPRFAIDFIRKRFAKKLSARYSAGDISAELQRRYDITVLAVISEDGRGVLLDTEEMVERMQERLSRLRSVLER